MSSLLEVAKEIIAKNNNKKNKAVPFKDLWAKVASTMKIKNPKDEEMISEFYMQLLQDPTFIKLNDNEWTLKQFHTYSEIEQMSATVLKTEEFEIDEADYKDYLSKYEISELNHKGRNSETTSLDLENLEASSNDDEDEDVFDDEVDDEADYDEEN